MEMFKKKANVDHNLTKQGLDNKLKVSTNFNPYIASGIDTHASVKYIEDITIYHKKIKESRLIGELSKDKNVKPRHRKRIVKDALKYWEKQFKSDAEYQKNLMLEQSRKFKKRRIKKIGKLYIYFFALITILGILVSNQISYLANTKIKFIGRFFTNMYDMIQTPEYNNIIVGLTYLALFATLYIIVLRTYLDETRKVGSNSEKFIENEFKKLYKRYKEQHKLLKKHMLKFVKRKYYKTHYKIKKIFDPQTVIKKLDQYNSYIKEKINFFQKFYYLFLFLNFVLKVSVIGLTIYLGIQYNNLY